MDGLRHAEIAKALHQVRKVAKLLKVLWLDPIWIEVHDIISNTADLLKLLDKDFSIEFKRELGPFVRLLNYRDVLSEGQIVC